MSAGYRKKKKKEIPGKIITLFAVAFSLTQYLKSCFGHSLTYIHFAHTCLEWTKGQAFHRASCPISMRQKERESGLWPHHWPRSAYSEKPIFECPFAGNPVYSETATVLFGTNR